MRFGSVCSGIEAASVAWHPLGWRASFLSEIEAFPRAVLSHHYPEVPLHGDFTTIRAGEYEPIDLLVGGTPCQSFSVAGLRGGLDDDRGNLALEYLRLADRLRPRWLVWENVPGVLSSNGGRDFGAILGGMVELGYGFAYRVLDAQFLGVAQRRRRVFVVGYAGDWRRAAAVLFERHSLSGHPAPRREKGQSAPTIPSRSSAGGGLGTDFDCDGGLIAHTLKGEGFDASEDGTGRGTPLVPVCFSAKDHGADAMHDCSPTLRAGGHSGSHANAGVMPAVCIPINADALRGEGTARTPSIDGAGRLRLRDPGFGVGDDGDPAGTLAAAGPGAVAVAYGITRDAIDRSGEGSGETPGERAGLGIIEEQAQCLKAKGPGAVAYALRTNQTGQNGPGYMEGIAPSLSADESPVAVAFDTTQITSPQYRTSLPPELCHTLNQGAHPPAIFGSAVRRLTPRECERLQGFPDDYTAIPYRKGLAADGPRYKALGNSMAVPVMRWIGQRIAQVDAIPHLQDERSAA